MDKKTKKQQKNEAKMENKLQKEIEKIQKELEEMTEYAKRTMADMQNLKRRQEEERKLITKMANTDLILGLLPVIDNMDRALDHAPKEAEKWMEGMEMNIKQLKKTLLESGLEEIDAINQPFNPELHEALAQGPGEKDTIIEVFEKGYKLGDRVIRHAKVKVGDGTSPETPQENTEERDKKDS